MSVNRHLSPIERMIDAACGYDSDAPPPLTGVEFGKAVATSVIDYLKYMYPDQYAKLSKSCQRSLRGQIVNSVASLAPRYRAAKARK